MSVGNCYLNGRCELSTQTRCNLFRGEFSFELECNNQIEGSCVGVNGVCRYVREQECSLIDYFFPNTTCSEYSIYGCCISGFCTEDISRIYCNGTIVDECPSSGACQGLGNNLN